MWGPGLLRAQGGGLRLRKAMVEIKTDRGVEGLRQIKGRGRPDTSRARAKTTKGNVFFCSVVYGFSNRAIPGGAGMDCTLHWQVVTWAGQ